MTTTTTTSLQPRYPDPGGNRSKEWVESFWPNEGDWEGFEEKLNRVSRGELYTNELFQFMVNDARSMIENGCNWTAALALLCFSEACGKLYATEVLGEGSLRPGENFQAFLDHCMECSDTEALEGELYGDVRSGLAHNFFLLREDHRISVSMGVDESNPDLSILASRGYDFIEDTDRRQVWRFACMPYFRQFLHGLDRLHAETARDNPRPQAENVNPPDGNDATKESQQQLTGSVKVHHEKNVDALLPLAQKQHDDRLNDIEGMDRKLGILLIAVGGVLAAGAKLPWLRSWYEGLLGAGFLSMSVLAFVLGICAFSVRSRKGVAVETFRRKYTTRSSRSSTIFSWLRTTKARTSTWKGIVERVNCST